jgi:hypothetical protein
MIAGEDGVAGAGDNCRRWCFTLANCVNFCLSPATPSLSLTTTTRRQRLPPAAGDKWFSPATVSAAVVSFLFACSSTYIYISFFFCFFLFCFSLFLLL